MTTPEERLPQPVTITDEYMALILRELQALRSELVKPVVELEGDEIELSEPEPKKKAAHRDAKRSAGRG